MSAQTIMEAFLPVEARYRAVVMKETWGHLAPRRNKKYLGHIVWAVGCFGSDDLNPTVLSCELEGLNDSPWFFDALTDFIDDQNGDGLDGKTFLPGHVYRFDGYFQNYIFNGTIREVVLQ